MIPGSSEDPSCPCCRQCRCGWWWGASDAMRKAESEGMREPPCCSMSAIRLAMNDPWLSTPSCTAEAQYATLRHTSANPKETLHPRGMTDMPEAGPWPGLMRPCPMSASTYACSTAMQGRCECADLGSNGVRDAKDVHHVGVRLDGAPRPLDLREQLQQGGTLHWTPCC